MITYVKGSLFESPAPVLVNTVNTAGVMGKGIAKEFKQYFPEMFEEYQRLCEDGTLVIGSLHFYRGPHKSVLNFPTKRNWRQRARLDDVKAGFETFVASYQDYSISSIAFPQLGCGNGELDWERDVRPLMEQHLRHLPIDVYIHIYAGDPNVPEHRDVRATKQWLRSEPTSLAFSEVWDDLKAFAASPGPGRSWSVLEDPAFDSFLAIDGEEGVKLISRDDLLDIWQPLRSYGFLSVDFLPDAFRAMGMDLLGVLRELPYIEPAVFGTSERNGRRSTDDLLGTASAGVRLVPIASDDTSVEVAQQAELFEPALKYSSMGLPTTLNYVTTEDAGQDGYSTRRILST